MLAIAERTLSGVTTYADRFQQGLARPGKSRAGAAKAMGISVQAVGQIALGRTKAATAENNAAAAIYFGCDPTWLATGKGSPRWNEGVAGPPPPRPNARFDDRRWVDDSDWATLQAVKVMMTKEDIDDLKRRYELLRQQVAAGGWTNGNTK